MKNIQKNSLIEKYLPADYVDSYSRIVACKQKMTPEEFRNFTFGQLPKWINRLMKLRDTIVKPLGLVTDIRFTDVICEKSPNEDIFGMPDRHLTFHVSMWCGEYQDGKQELRITTVVKYNNWLGRVYFFAIRPFHKVIVHSILKYQSSGCRISEQTVLRAA